MFEFKENVNLDFFNSRDKLFNKAVQNNLKKRWNVAKHHISILGKFGVFSFLRS